MKRKIVEFELPNNKKICSKIQHKRKCENDDKMDIKPKKRIVIYKYVGGSASGDEEDDMVIENQMCKMINLKRDIPSYIN